MKYTSETRMLPLFARVACTVSFLAGIMGAPQSMAQVSVKVPGVNVNVGGNENGNVSVSIGGKNNVGNTAGHIDEDVDMQGVAVINGEVTIDGEKVPKGKTRHTGRKTGTKYIITWGKDGNVAVSQE